MDERSQQEIFDKLSRKALQLRRISWICYTFASVYFFVSGIASMMDLDARSVLFFGTFMIFLGIGLILTQRSRIAHQYSTYLRERADQSDTHRDPIRNNGSLEQGREFREKLTTYSNLIAEEQVKQDLSMIAKYLSDMIETAQDHRDCQKETEKVIRVYMPQLTDLLDRYLELVKRNVENQEVKHGKVLIQQAVSDAREAFGRINEDLLERTNMDLAAQVEAFGDSLRIDGLLGEELRFEINERDQTS